LPTRPKAWTTFLIKIQRIFPATFKASQIYLVGLFAFIQGIMILRYFKRRSNTTNITASYVYVKDLSMLPFDIPGKSIDEMQVSKVTEFLANDGYTYTVNIATLGALKKAITYNKNAILREMSRVWYTGSKKLYQLQQRDKLLVSILNQEISTK
jgi:hypothetical protein